MPSALVSPSPRTLPAAAADSSSSSLWPRLIRRRRVSLPIRADDLARRFTLTALSPRGYCFLLPAGSPRESLRRSKRRRRRRPPIVGHVDESIIGPRVLVTLANSKKIPASTTCSIAGRVRDLFRLTLFSMVHFFTRISNYIFENKTPLCIYI